MCTSCSDKVEMKIHSSKASAMRSVQSLKSYRLRVCEIKNKVIKIINSLSYVGSAWNNLANEEGSYSRCNDIKSTVETQQNCQYYNTISLIECAAVAAPGCCNVNCHYFLC